jgi:hypothetical protein
LVIFLLIFNFLPWLFCQSFYNFQLCHSNQVHGFYIFNDDDDDDDDDNDNDNNCYTCAALRRSFTLFGLSTIEVQAWIAS